MHLLSTHLTNVRMESERQLTVTTRSPQIQQSSIWGSIDAPSISYIRLKTQYIRKPKYLPIYLYSDHILMYIAQL